MGDGNLGSNRRHITTIVEQNIAPQVALTVRQDDQSVLIVEQNGTLVDFAATVSDGNPDDQHTAEWRFSRGVLPQVVGELQRKLDPADLVPGTYNVTVIVTDSGVPAITNEISLTYRVVDKLAVLTEQDTDGDSIADVIEGWRDDDQDGQPNYLDAQASTNVINEGAGDGSGFLIEADPGLKMVLGERAIAMGMGGANFVAADLPEGLKIPSDEMAEIGEYFDFVVNDLAMIGQSVNVVLPQRQPIPTNAVYRKFDGVWYTFVEDANNGVMSAPGEQGSCPPPQSDAFSPGLQAGAWCVQLTIEDGGPNDADGVANGSVNDPGGVASLAATPASNSGVNASPAVASNSVNNSTSGGGSFGWGLVMLVFSLLGLHVARTRQTIQKRQHQ
jgi:hypothetical protein